MKGAARTLNHLLAALVELAALVAFILFGWSLFSGFPARLAAAAACGAAAVCMWGRYAAPRSPRRLPPAGLILFKAAFFALASGAIFALDRLGVCAGFSACACLQLSLAAALRDI